MTLYATDLDGTLLRSDKSISDETAGLLNRLVSEGVLFTYATARSISSASPLIQNLNLSCPAVTFNGVFVIDPKTGRHIVENVFTEASLNTAVDFFNRLGLAPLVYSYIDGRERVSYLEDKLDDVYGYVSTRQGDKRLRPVKSREELFLGTVFYFTLLDPPVDYALLDEVFTRENGFAVNIMPDTYNKNEIWYEIFSRNASKASALLQVMELTRADRLVCFGDNTNDLSMINAADVGVAVSNACAELKKAADRVIGSNDEGAVARYIAEENGIAVPEVPAKEVPATVTSKDRFSQALSAAMIRIRGMHGSVGTQNEKLIHAVLKNYYAPFADDQEVRIGEFFADAVNEDGIFEIQTKKLYKLREKLAAFTDAARVTIVHPVEAMTRSVYINSDTGEVVQETPFRRVNQRQKIYEELYSIRDFLANERITIILARLKVERRIAFRGDKLPEMRSRSARKKAEVTKIPLELLEETVYRLPEGLGELLTEGLPERFTKKEFCKAAKEPESSLRLEVLRAAGLIEKVGKQGNCYVYSITERSGGND
ncbi:MAG: HAD family hydrolase [Oscillospiraceae bacterium]